MKRVTGTMIFVALLLQGCVTGTQSSVNGVAGEVIERSREIAPSWAGLRPFTMHDQNLSYHYVHIESRHPDLPLGIKKTQLNALSQGKDAFRNNLRTAIMQVAQSVSVPVEPFATSVSGFIDSACDQGWAQNAKVADIFFEKFRPAQREANTPEDFYNIYVMVEMPKAAMAESLRSVAKRLKGSSRPEHQRVGNVLDGRISVLAD